MIIIFFIISCVIIAIIYHLEDLDRKKQNKRYLEIIERNALKEGEEHRKCYELMNKISLIAEEK